LANFLDTIPKNMTVMIFSDHGFHMGGWGKPLGAWDYHLESALPILIMTKPLLDEVSLKHLEEN